MATPKRTPPGNPSNGNPKRKGAALLPFDESAPLRADDPSPQRVPQIPTAAARPMLRQKEEAIPTTVFDLDQELRASYDPVEVSDGGHRPAFLYVGRGPGSGQLIPVKQGPLVIGRASVSELRLQHPSVSRRHAQLTRVDERFYLKDLGSQNGTFVNKVRIETEIELFPGDEIAVGNALLKLRGPLQAAQAPQPDSKTKKPHGKRKGTMRVAVFASAMGFGLAGVLAVVLLKFPSTPRYQNLAPDSPPAPAASVEIASAPVVTQEEKVQEAVRRAMEEGKVAAETPRPAEVEPAPSVVEPEQSGAETEAAGAKRAPEIKAEPARLAKAATKPEAKAKAREEARDEDRSEREAAPVKPTGEREPLKRYEAGDLGGAIEAASRADQQELVAKLTKFRNAYEGAQAAVKAGNGTTAIQNYTAALELDEQLSSGWSKFGSEIRKELSNLWTRVGFVFLEEEEEEAARKAFSKATSYDPGNAKAKAQLSKLKRQPAPAAETEEKPNVSSRAAEIDAAFGD